MVAIPQVGHAATSPKFVSGTPFYIRFIGVPTELRAPINSAAFLWGQNFFSKVPVTINVTMKDEQGDDLATGTPSQFFHNFPGAPARDIDYSAALANAITGKDLTHGGSEITISIDTQNINLLYLGTDGRCPSNRYDFESVMIHEIAHGLGFISNVSDFNGYGTYTSYPTAFDAFLQSSDGRELIDLNDGTELGNALIAPVTWNGSIGRIANGGTNPKLYTPNPFEPYSSISHIDPTVPTLTHANLLMHPTFNMGDVYRSPGTLLRGMLQDMRNPPPLGKPTAVPSPPTKVAALVSNSSVILTFDAPNNYRGSHITGYRITGVGNSFSALTAASPFTIKGLKNSKSYTFSVQAVNALGSSTPVESNPITPQAPWKSQVVDSNITTSKIAAVTINGVPTLAYADTRTGDLKIAQNLSGKWKISKIDGAGGIGPNRNLKIAGPVSLCTPNSPTSKAPQLNIFYLDSEKRYLHYAAYNGKHWSYSVVDGDGQGINPDTSVNRGRTGSDISTSNACVVNGNKVEVFYRDENLGMLLGATLQNSAWHYEVIDGDRTSDGRTKGDVATNLSAAVHGNYTYVLYSSVNAINPPDQITEEDVRLAVRNENTPSQWFYTTLSQDSNFPVQGNALVISTLTNTVVADWLASSAISLGQPDTIFSASVTGLVKPNVVDISQLVTNISQSQSTFNSFGSPGLPITRSNANVYYSCQNRVCELSSLASTASSGVHLVNSTSLGSNGSIAALLVNNKEYLFANVNGVLQGFYQ